MGSFARFQIFSRGAISVGVISCNPLTGGRESSPAESGCISRSCVADKPLWICCSIRCRWYSSLNGVQNGRRPSTIAYIMIPLQRRHNSFHQPVNPSQCRGDYSAASNDMKSVHWPLMDGMLHSVVVQRGGDWVGPQPAQAFLAVRNVTAHPSAPTVLITVLLYNGPLLCGFNVPIYRGLGCIITPSSSLSTFASSMGFRPVASPSDNGGSFSSDFGSYSGFKNWTS